MLADWLNEPTGMLYPGGVSHDAMMAPLRRRIAQARLFVLGPDAVAMAANVSMSKPSSLLAALPWVRLPADLTFLEFSNLEMRDAMAQLGSPNLTPPNAVVAVLRSGFLMRLEGRRLTMDYVHTDKTPDGRHLTDLAPVQLYFDLGDEERPVVETALRPAAGPGLSGRVLQHFRLVSKDPAEARAEADLRSRFSWAPHPDLTAAAAAFAADKGREFVESIQANQASDGWRVFCGMVLPGLILLNCRNAVRTEEVEPSAKLNKNRIGRRRPALLPYGLVKMKLGAGRAAGGRRRGMNAAALHAVLVIGHFKVRRTGVFWWSPFMRSGQGGLVPPRPTVLTS